MERELIPVSFRFPFYFLFVLLVKSFYLSGWLYRLLVIYTEVNPVGMGLDNEPAEPVGMEEVYFSDTILYSMCPG